jgi:hypothetical protein
MDSTRLKALQQRETVSLRHLDVKEYQVRNDTCVQALTLRDGSALANDAHLRVARKKGFDAMARERFIIDNEDRQRR